MTTKENSDRSMAQVTMTQDLQQVCKIIGTRDGVACVDHPHVACPQFQLTSPERKINRF